MSKRFNKFPRYIAKKLSNEYGSLESLSGEFSDEGFSYKIPSELLIRSESKSRKFPRYDHGIYLNYIAFGKNLTYLTELTVQEYYDILVLGIVDKNKRPKCPNCGKYIPWGRTIGENYRYEFCCHECSVEYRESHPEYSKDWTENSLSNIHSWSDKDFYEFVIYKDYKRDLKKMMDLSDEAYFYIIRFNSKIKIGVSVYDHAIDRIRRSVAKDKTEFIRSEVYKGSVQECLQLEYELKLKNYNNLIFDRSQDICWTEYFNTNMTLYTKNLIKLD